MGVLARLRVTPVLIFEFVFWEIDRPSDAPSIVVPLMTRTCCFLLFSDRLSSLLTSW